MLPKTELSSRPPVWASQTGLAGLYLFAFFAFLGHVGSAVGLLLMLVALTVSFREVLAQWRKDPAAWLAAGFVVYLLLHPALAAIESSPTTDTQWREVHAWVRLFAFLIVAWWMAGEPKRIYWCWALALAGFLIRLLIETDATDILMMQRGRRTGFAYSVNFAGILSGACLIAMLLLSRRVLKIPSTHKARLLMALFWLASLAAVYQVHITAQRRGAWLSTIIGLALALVLFGLRRFDRRLIITLGLALVTLGAIAFQNISTFERQIARDRSTFSALLDGTTIEQIPFNGSAERRIHMLHFGLKRWLERPLFGWGPGTVITRQFQSKRFADPLDRTQARELARVGHLHNGFVTLLAQLGLVGAAFGCAMIYVIVRQLRVAAKEELLPHDLIVTTAAVLLAAFLSNMTTTPLTTIDFQLLLSLFLAAAYTTRFRQPKDSPAPAAYAAFVAK